MHEDLAIKVASHDASIDHMVRSIERLADTAEKTNDKLDHLVESAGQTAVILEKIASIDEKNRDSVNRLHKRVDDTIETILLKEAQLRAEVKELTTNANKGGLIYDFLVTLGKVTAILVPVVGALWSLLVILIDK